MQVAISAIGNSKGIRIPKKILEMCGFGDSAQLYVEDNHIIVSPTKPREGWEVRFRDASEDSSDSVNLNPFPNYWDNLEWEW